MDSIGPGGRWTRHSSVQHKFFFNTNFFNTKFQHKFFNAKFFQYKNFFQYKFFNKFNKFCVKIFCVEAVLLQQVCVAVGEAARAKRCKG